MRREQVEDRTRGGMGRKQLKDEKSDGMVLLRKKKKWRMKDMGWGNRRAKGAEGTIRGKGGDTVK